MNVINLRSLQTTIIEPGASAAILTNYKGGAYKKYIFCSHVSSVKGCGFSESRKGTIIILENRNQLPVTLTKGMIFGSIIHGKKKSCGGDASQKGKRTHTEPSDSGDSD